MAVRQRQGETGPLLFVAAEFLSLSLSLGLKALSGEAGLVLPSALRSGRKVLLVVPASSHSEEDQRTEFRASNAHLVMFFPVGAL